jgi:serine/threonine protein kinase
MFSRLHMPLDPETRLGPYEIVCAIGAGGMGQVYRARDLRLGRDVEEMTTPAIQLVANWPKGFDQ